MTSNLLNLPPFHLGMSSVMLIQTAIFLLYLNQNLKN